MFEAMAITNAIRRFQKQSESAAREQMSYLNPIATDLASEINTSKQALTEKEQLKHQQAVMTEQNMNNQQLSRSSINADDAESSDEDKPLLNASQRNNQFLSNLGFFFFIFLVHRFCLRCSKRGYNKI